MRTEEENEVLWNGITEGARDAWLRNVQVQRDRILTTVTEVTFVAVTLGSEVGQRMLRGDGLPGYPRDVEVIVCAAPTYERSRRALEDLYNEYTRLGFITQRSDHTSFTAEVPQNLIDRLLRNPEVCRRLSDYAHSVNRDESWIHIDDYANAPSVSAAIGRMRRPEVGRFEREYILSMDLAAPTWEDTCEETCNCNSCHESRRNQRITEEIALARSYQVNPRDLIMHNSVIGTDVITATGENTPALTMEDLLTAHRHMSGN